jgi:hypothetical protein
MLHRYPKLDTISVSPESVEGERCPPYQLEMCLGRVLDTWDGYLNLEDPPKSPLKRGTLNGSVPSFLRRIREDQKALKHCLSEDERLFIPARF